MNGNCGECDRRWHCEIDPAECDNLTEPVLTNADRIRAMSDEELVELLDYDLGCPATGNCEKMNRDCKACWLDWLQQPAETEEKK